MSVVRIFFWLVSFVIVFTVADAQSKRTKLPSVDTVSNAQIHQMVKRDSGKVTLVNVWATWCDPCKKEIPSLLKLRKKFSAKGFDLIFVSADDVELAQTKVRKTLGNLGVDFQTYIKQDSTDETFIMDMSPDWNGALPTSFLYDKEGKLKDIMIGKRTYEQFQDRKSVV